MWRQTDERKVWYEWMVEVFSTLPPPPAAIADDKGKGKGRDGDSHSPTTATAAGAGRRRQRRQRIGGSDLHSSVKEGCLM